MAVVIVPLKARGVGLKSQVSGSANLSAMQPVVVASVLMVFPNSVAHLEPEPWGDRDVARLQSREGPFGRDRYPRFNTTAATAPAAPHNTTDTTASTSAAFIVLVFMVPRFKNPK